MVDLREVISSIDPVKPLTEIYLEYCYSTSIHHLTDGGGGGGGGGGGEEVCM